VTYSPVKWNRKKRVYDLVILGGVAAYLGVFLLVGSLVWTGEEAIGFPILLMRAFGTCAFAMLHVVLGIGPLARIGGNGQQVGTYRGFESPSAP